MGFWGWSTTPASNDTTLGVNIGENCSPANINDAIRKLMADARAAFNSTLTSFLASTDIPTARTALGLGTAATMPETTAAEYRANTAGRLISTDKAWSAAGFVALAPGATVNIALSSGFNFTLAMGGNYTLANPTAMKEGQTGCIVISQDATGSRTLAYGSAWLFAGGVDPALSTAANAKDLLFYQVLPGATTIYGNLLKGVA